MQERDSQHSELPEQFAKDYLFREDMDQEISLSSGVSLSLNVETNNVPSGSEQHLDCRENSKHCQRQHG